jgi:phosphohistidine phosphatase SixA
MTGKIALMRHGKAGYGNGDFDRALTSEGVNTSREHLLELRQVFTPDRIICSGATRTLETAQIAQEIFGLDDSAIRADNSLYMAEMDAYFAVMQESLKEGLSLLVVGHNPEITDMGILVETGRMFFFHTSYICCFDIDITDGMSLKSAFKKATNPVYIPHKFMFVT